MPTQEIKDSHWQAFCEHFEELNKGTPITLEVVGHDGGTSITSRGRTLKAFRFERGKCNDYINLELDGAGGQPLQHQIIDPLHVRLREKADHQKELEIDAESGSVEIRFTNADIGQ